VLCHPSNDAVTGAPTVTVELDDNFGF
jgi:hypothetical protein